MTDNEIADLKKKLDETLPKYSLRETLKTDLDLYNKKDINTQWIENLFLLKGYKQWDVVGEVLAKMKIRQLDISLCIITTRVANVNYTTDWPNFIRMIDKTYIHDLKVGPHFPKEYLADPHLIKTLQRNRIKTFPDKTLAEMSMSKILDYGIWYKNKIPVELETSLDKRSEEISKSTRLVV